MIQKLQLLFLLIPFLCFFDETKLFAGGTGTGTMTSMDNQGVSMPEWPEETAETPPTDFNNDPYNGYVIYEEPKREYFAEDTLTILVDVGLALQLSKKISREDSKRLEKFYLPVKRRLREADRELGMRFRIYPMAIGGGVVHLSRSLYGDGPVTVAVLSKDRFHRLWNSKLAIDGLKEYAREYGTEEYLPQFINAKDKRTQVMMGLKIWKVKDPRIVEFDDIYILYDAEKLAHKLFLVRDNITDKFLERFIQFLTRIETPKLDEFLKLFFVEEE